MSADNWTLCPRCLDAAAKRQAKMDQAAADAYGKVPPEEYFRLLQVAKDGEPLESTLREDYEIGVDGDGIFAVNYRAGCTRCDFTFEFTDEKKVPWAKAKVAR